MLKQRLHAPSVALLLFFSVACQSTPDENSQSHKHDGEHHHEHGDHKHPHKSTVDKTVSPDMAKNSRTVLYTIEITVPASTKPGLPIRIWIPTPQQLPGQSVSESSTKIVSGIDESKATIRITKEKTYGNAMTYVEFLGVTKEVTIRHSALCTREQISAKNKNLTPVSNSELFLKANTLVPINDEAKRRSDEAIQNKTGKAATRALFEATLKHMAYDKSGEGWGLGNFEHACDVGKGNCTDFHAYYIGMARAAKIPARFEIGYSLPAEAREGVIKGYHCWAFTEVDKQWWPVDISEAWKNPKAKESNYGELSPNRITVSTGRDITLEPKQQGKALNYFVFPYAEAGGSPLKLEFKRQFSSP